MKTIIAGSIDFHNYEDFLMLIKFVFWNLTLIMSGKAKEVDSLGRRYAKENKIPIMEYVPNWDKYGIECWSH